MKMWTLMVFLELQLQKPTPLRQGRETVR